MKKQVIKITVVYIFLFSITGLCLAQKPKPTVKPVTTQKYNSPKLKTSLSNLSDSVITVSVDQAVDLINMPLVISENKKIVYTISLYQCMYKRRAVTENEETGKVSPITSMVANVFKTTPLPEIWKKTITEQLKPGEEIFFFDVVVKDAQGRLMFAPNLKLVVQ